MKIINKQSITKLDGNKSNRDNPVFINDMPLDKNGNKLPFPVAMVAKCVSHYRKQLRPLQTIWLCASYYNQFDYWSRSHALEEQADLKIEKFTFDGVFIEKMGTNHVIKHGDDSMDWDFYAAKALD